VILPDDIAALIATYLERWGGVNMTVTAVPVYPLRARPTEAPARPAIRAEASQKLGAVLANFAQELVELAAHLLTCLDLWYQARAPFADGHYDRAIELAEVAQTLVDEITNMKESFPPPVVPDHIWGGEEKIA
jgi:hypothetical protein